MNTFALVVGTRGHPRRANAALEVALHFAHEPERVIPVVSIDEDDIEAAHCQWGERIVVVSGPRPTGLGDVWNRAAHRVDAEFYIHAADDGVIASPGWDAVIDAALTAVPMRELAVVCLNDTTNRGLPTHPVVSREWIRLTGRWFDSRFPFWFIDSALNELAAFTTAAPVPIVNQVCVSVKNGPTARMRDLRLWTEFFRATRAERVAKAGELRGMLGLDRREAEIAAMAAHADAGSAIMIANADENERRLADTRSDPPPGYEKARAYAERYLTMEALL